MSRTKVTMYENLRSYFPQKRWIGIENFEWFDHYCLILTINDFNVVVKDGPRILWRQPSKIEA